MFVLPQVGPSDKKSSLIIALFFGQAPYLNFFQVVMGRVNGFLESAGSCLPSAQNNPRAKVAHFGAADSAPFQRCIRSCGGHKKIICGHKKINKIQPLPLSLPK